MRLRLGYLEYSTLNSHLTAVMIYLSRALTPTEEPDYINRYLWEIKTQRTVASLLYFSELVAQNASTEFMVRKEVEDPRNWGPPCNFSVGVSLFRLDRPSMKELWSHLLYK